MNCAGRHRIRTDNGCCRAILLLAFTLAATGLAGPAHAAGACPAVSPEPGSTLAEFERRIEAMDDRESIQEGIREQLCARNNIFVFLTGESGYDYVSCFLDGKDADRFWNADHSSSRRMLADFRHACANWANSRYRNLLNKVASREKPGAKGGNTTAVNTSRAKEAMKPRPSAAPKPSAAAIRERAQQAIRQAMTAAGPSPQQAMLQWKGNAADGGPTPGELSAWLLALELDTEDTAPSAHSGNHLDEMLGAPRIASVRPAEKPNGYRVTIRSQRMDIALEAWVEGEHAPSADSKAWILFRHEGNALLPTAAVLHDRERVFRAVRIEGGPLKLKTPPENGRTRLEEHGDALHLKIRCVPQGGGRAMPLGSCLRPDGEIRVLDSSTGKQLRYDTLPRSQRGFEIALRPPFLLLARTGDGNRRGELETVITRPGEDSRGPVYRHRAIARHDNIFVYSE